MEDSTSLRRVFGGRAFHDGQQQLDFFVPAPGILQMVGKRGVENIGRIALGRELLRKFGELPRSRAGKQALLLVAIDALDRLVGQLVEALDDLLHRCGGGGGLGHGDFLHGMLEQRAGGLELFQHVGAVDQLGDSDLVARQEIGHQPADGGAGVIGIKIFGLEAGQGVRGFFLRRGYRDLVMALFENLQGEIVAGIVVVGFLDDLDAGGLLRGHQPPGKFDGAVAAVAHVMQRPGALGAAAAKNLVMDLPAHVWIPLRSQVCTERT